MSSATAELISDWNEMITYKIKESDLLQPTETFVTKALSSLLGAMFMKDSFTLKMYSENKFASQIAKAKFVQYIDGLYKVSDAKNNFLYIDLIQPTSRKTIHLLKILYNYFCYYMMIRTNILGHDADALESNDKLMKANKDLKIEIERSNIRQEMMDKKTESYKKELPVVKNQLEGTYIYLKQLSQELEKRKRSIETTIASNKDALKKIETLNGECIDEVEVKNLISDKQKLERELSEIKEHETANSARALDYHKKREEIQAILSKISKLFEFLNLESALKVKAEAQSLEQDREGLKDKLEKVQEDLIGLKKDFEAQIKATNKKTTAKKKKIRTQQKKKATLHKENNKYRNILAQFKEEMEEETALLQKSKQELEKILTLAQQTLEYIVNGYISFNGSEAA